MRAGLGRQLAIRKDSRVEAHGAKRASGSLPACAALLVLTACGSANQPGTQLGPIGVGGNVATAAGTGTSPAGSSAAYRLMRSPNSPTR